MALPKAQNPQDWLTQLWNIALGKRVNENKDHWLLGPIGDIGGIADRFIERLAKEEGLSGHYNLPSSGLLEGFQQFDSIAGRVNPRIEYFYRTTIDYELDVWTQWRPMWGSLDYLVYKLFSQRNQQLNLPRTSLDAASGLKSDIITLLDDSGDVAYRVWFRRLQKNDEVVYSGIYSHCTIPSRETCVKVIFPLPQGSATVIMRAAVDDRGNLELVSSGKDYGDSGFCFIVQDRVGHLWKHYLPSFRERIFVYEDNSNILRADHSMSLWKWRTYDLRYKIRPKKDSSQERVS